MSKQKAARKDGRTAGETATQGNTCTAVAAGTKQTDGEIVAYPIENAATLDVRLDGDTVWLTQKQMAVLFGCAKENIRQHIRNIFADEELDQSSTAKDFLVVDIEGKRHVARTVTCYNLDAIISVGYRVNSKRGVAFRQWATKTLKERLLRGYVPKSAPRILPYEEADADAVRRAARVANPSNLIGLYRADYDGGRIVS